MVSFVEDYSVVPMDCFFLFCQIFWFPSSCYWFCTGGFTSTVLNALWSLKLRLQQLTLICCSSCRSVYGEDGKPLDTLQRERITPHLCPCKCSVTKLFPS